MKKLNKKTIGNKNRNLIIIISVIIFIFMLGSFLHEELSLFSLNIPDKQVPKYNTKGQSFKKVDVPYDLEMVKREQESTDAGHSPWRLDPAFVTQVFVSLKISPGGITGEYPIKYEDIKVIKQNDSDAITEISGSETPIKRVYLKRLIRQDNTGIWTVVGYEPKK